MPHEPAGRNRPHFPRRELRGTIAGEDGNASGTLRHLGEVGANLVTGGWRMAQMMWKPALALGAVLAAGSFAAADDTVRLGGPAKPGIEGSAGKSGIAGATMTLGGQGTVAEAASAGD